MTDDEMRAALFKLGDRFSKALDNPRQLAILQRQMDILWAKYERGKK